MDDKAALSTWVKINLGLVCILMIAGILLYFYSRALKSDLLIDLKTKEDNWKVI